MHFNYDFYAETENDRPQQKERIPTREEIRRLATNSAIVHQCFRFGRSVDLVEEEIYRLCIAELVKQNDVLMSDRLEQARLSPPPVVIVRDPPCNCGEHERGRSTGGWWCPVHKRQF